MDSVLEDLCIKRTSQPDPDNCAHCQPNNSPLEMRQFVMVRVIDRGFRMLPDFVKFCAEQQADLPKEFLFSIQAILLLGLSRTLYYLDWTKFARNYATSELETYVRQRKKLVRHFLDAPALFEATRGHTWSQPLENCQAHYYIDTPTCQAVTQLSHDDEPVDAYTSFDQSLQCLRCPKDHNAMDNDVFFCSDSSMAPTFFSQPTSPDLTCYTSLVINHKTLTELFDILHPMIAAHAESRSKNPKVRLYVWSLLDFLTVPNNTYAQLIRDLNARDALIEVKPLCPAFSSDVTSEICRTAGISDPEEFIYKVSSLRTWVNSQVDLDLYRTFSLVSRLCHQCSLSGLGVRQRLE